MSLLLLLLPAAWAAPAWFLSDVDGDVVEVDADGKVVGAPMWLTGELLIRAEDPESLRATPEVVEVRPVGDGAVQLLTLAEGVEPTAMARKLQAQPGVLWCHPNLRVALVPTAQPDDPLYPDQWHLESVGQEGATPGVDINAEAAWDLSTGAGMTIAIVDTGVQTDHPDLRVTSGTDFVDGDGDSSPDPEGGNPHGTAAAGLAAAAGDNGLGVTGVAWEADVYGIRLIGGETTLDQTYEAFVEATDAGAAVVSNSWGFGEGCPQIPLYAVLRDAIDYVEENGRGGLGGVVVVSAGNGNCDNSRDYFQGYAPVVSVAASDRHDRRESYSSYGDPVDIAAPSGGVLTTDMPGAPGYGAWDGEDDYYTFSGTSASAPIVSGVFALMFAANPRLTAADARDALCYTANRIDVDSAGYDSAGWSPYYGCGRVDAGAAVAAVADTPPSVPQPIVTDVYFDQLVLRWEPSTDADGDRLRYELGWSVFDRPDEIVEVDGTSINLTGHIEIGAELTWWVRAIDDWGPGEASEPVVVDVLAAPKAPKVVETGRCAAGRGEGSLLLALAGLLGLTRRRRSGS